MDQCLGLLKRDLRSWLSEVAGKAEALGLKFGGTAKDSRVYARRLSVGLEMNSFAVLLCSVGSEAEGKDSGTFLCTALSVNPTNQLRPISPNVKRVE